MQAKARCSAVHSKVFARERKTGMKQSYTTEEVVKEAKRLMAIYDRGRGKNGDFYDGFRALARWSLRMNKQRKAR